MKTHRTEVADVFRNFQQPFLRKWGKTLSHLQKRALRDILQCRTAALGGHRKRCQSCGHEQNFYNSCRNRHCPKCQATARAKWMDDRAAELLPVPYFHVVFTLPAIIAQLALQNKHVVYDILFKAASQTLLKIAADPKHLGAKIGLMAVLHTWGQKLDHHPHLHCVLPAGGISKDRSRWVRCKRSRKTGKLFFLPVQVLSEVFRGKFLHLLRQAFRQGRLSFYGRMLPYANVEGFEQLLNLSVRSKWVVYAKRLRRPVEVLGKVRDYSNVALLSIR